MNKTIHIAFRWRRRHGHITDEIDCIHRQRVLKIDILHHEHWGVQNKTRHFGTVGTGRALAIIVDVTGRRATVSN